MHFRSLDLNLLPVFDALWRQRSTTLAALELGLTQPAVSHALNRLRDYYRDPLFRLTKSRMEPTERAEELAKPIAQALTLIAMTLESDFDPSRIQRTVRIALVNYNSIHLVPNICARLKADSPLIRIILEHMPSHTATTLLSRDDIDYAIGEIEIREKDLSYTRLSHGRWTVVAIDGVPVAKHLPTSSIWLIHRKNSRIDQVQQWMTRRITFHAAEIAREFDPKLLV